MADELNGEISFSPVLIMEYIRQTTVARFLNSESLDIVVRFKIKKEYYDEMKAYHQQVQFIRLYDEYDERKLTPGTSWFAVGRDGKASPIAQLVRAPH